MLKKIRTVLNSVDSTIRLVGFAANLALVLGFAWSTNKLYAKATSALESIGPLPGLDVLSVTTWATNPAAVDRLLAIGTLWVCAILALGCGWMTLLGLRWCYHCTLAIIEQLKFKTDKALT